MSWKKVLGLVGAVGLGFIAGAAAGYVRALNDVDMEFCPENCECAGECAMCAGAHAVAAEAQAAADAATEDVPVEAPVEPVSGYSVEASVCDGDAIDPADAEPEASVDAE